MIRTILDTNIWVSFLLKAKRHGPIDQIVTAAFRENVELIVPQELIVELRSVFVNSQYLASRVSKANVDALIERLYADATVLPISRQTTRYTRDPKDDYLVAYSVAHAVDYLVTGDHDLLSLYHVGNLRIVTPIQFLAVLS